MDWRIIVHYDNREIFVVTEDHIKLLKRMYVSWDDCEYGAPGINPKRPYGNSDVANDIAEILEWNTSQDDYELPEEYCIAAEKIHREMQIALQILVNQLQISPGVYRKALKYDSTSWRRVQENEATD